MAKKISPSRKSGKTAPKGKGPTAKAAKKPTPTNKKAASPKKSPAKGSSKAKVASKAKPNQKGATKKPVATKKSTAATRKTIATKGSKPAAKAPVKKVIKTVLAKKEMPKAKSTVTPSVKKPVQIAKPAPTAPAPKAPKATAIKPTPERPVVPVPKDPEPSASKTQPLRKHPAKERVVMEFYLNSTPTALYDQISTPSGFSEWYCQDVDVRGDQYTFIWDQEREETTLIGRKLGEVIRFRRNDDEDPEAFFEFRIRVDAMTNEVALVVTDHAWPGEVEETRNLWASQIHSLMRFLGA